MNDDKFVEKLQNIIGRYSEISQILSEVGNIENISRSDFAKLSKERSDITEVVDMSRVYLNKLEEIREADRIITENQFDEELILMAKEEKNSLNDQVSVIKDKLYTLLLPKDADDDKGVVLEVYAATGGEEAALFAVSLFHMYQKYSENYGWKFEVLSFSKTGLSGYKEASAYISGNSVFSRLKFESGVHRVQRVPATEKNGRVHTSTVAVSILPEADEIDVKLDQKDLRIDVYRSSGAGGQHVNTTDSAVRVTHIPTGIAVCQQDEKSQHKNKAKALKILFAKLYELKKSEDQSKRLDIKQKQIGKGTRSEKIRTYNYPQDRVTDHRLNKNHSLNDIIENGSLDTFINFLMMEERAAMLSAL